MVYLPRGFVTPLPLLTLSTALGSGEQIGYRLLSAKMTQWHLCLAKSAISVACGACHVASPPFLRWLRGLPQLLGRQSYPSICARLVVDVAQMVLHRIRTDTKHCSYAPVSQSAANQGDNLFFPCCKAILWFHQSASLA
jgi:hypothetical protein